MPNRFEVPDDESPPPSTPDRGRRGQNYYDDGPSTTPAGPPPSSAMTFTPAGDPSASYLHSSLMQGFTNPKPLNFGKPTSGNASRRPLGNSQLGRSIRGSQPKERARSGLSRTLAVENEEDAEGDYGEDPPDGAEDAGDVEEDASGEDDDMYDGDGAQSAEFLSKEPDLLFATPAANERVRKEAEDIYRASTMRSTMGGARRREFKFDTVARDLYSRIPHADLTEPADVILGTEYLVNRLYDEGVGPEDDAERLDTALAMVSGALVDLWNGYVGTLPPPEEEHAAEIGPSPHAEPFEHAFFLSNVVLQLRHSRNPPSPSSSRLGGSVGSGRGLQTPPLPATLFDWLRTSHNLYPDQLRDVERHLPNPVAHALYWPTVFTSLIRGDVPGAIRLLRAADWSVVKKGAAAGGGRRAEQAYTGRTLDNVRRAVQDTADMLALCPAAKAATPAAGVSSTAAGAAAAAAWDIWTEDWVMFRVQARGARDRLTRFVEGKDQLRSQASRDSPSADAGSFTSLARRAESQVPWEVYENLQTVYEIVMGRPNAIMTAAQDWCEATVGLCAWADEQRELHLDSDKSRDKRALQLARDAAAAGDVEATERYFDRLARCFHTVVGSEFHFNPMNPVEVGIACVFEGNYEAVIGFLRAWSLPVASAVAEIGSLGRWLPRGGLSASSASLKALLPAVEDLDMEDLEVLGMGDVAAAAGAAASPEDVDGVKDHTLICYARSLAAIDELRVSTTTSPVASFGAAKPVPLESRSGWEVAVHVLGRMDSPERSEELVGELIHSILEKVDLDSSATVDKIWTLLNLLGMINFAEEAAEVGNMVNVSLDALKANAAVDLCGYPGT